MKSSRTYAGRAALGIVVASLRRGSLPIGLIRRALTKQTLTRAMAVDWKFYGDLPSK